ncbi:MAG: hypothetical protein HY788_10405 [Deltaproteobacteria bacterium]|nr:hypothetical protein [Deltaproteobacteria bacterium]
MPRSLARTAAASEVVDGRRWRTLLPDIEKAERPLVWVDEYGTTGFYDRPIRAIAGAIPTGGILCVRNFSPYNGAPGRFVLFDAECTLEAAGKFARRLMEQPFQIRLASPEACFGDYVNAGHWLVASRA